MEPTSKHISRSKFMVFSTSIFKAFSLQANSRLFIYKQIQGFLYEQIDFKVNLYLACVAIYLLIYHEWIEAHAMNLIYVKAKSSL
jgi:hypothetical protein